MRMKWYVYVYVNGAPVGCYAQDSDVLNMNAAILDWDPFQPENADFLVWQSVCWS